MFGLSKVKIGTLKIGTVITTVGPVLFGLSFLVGLQSDQQVLQKWQKRINAVEEARSAAVDEIKKLKTSAMSELRRVASAREKTLGEIKSAHVKTLGKIKSAREFNQVNCHLIDSGKHGGRLSCPVGEYVAGATNRTGTNDQLDFLLCCKP